MTMDTSAVDPNPKAPDPKLLKCKMLELQRPENSIGSQSGRQRACLRSCEEADLISSLAFKAGGP